MRSLIAAENIDRARIRSVENGMLKTAERQLALAVRINSELRHTAGKTSSKVKFPSLVEGWAWQFGMHRDGAGAATAVAADAPAAADGDGPVEGVSRLYRRVKQYWEVNCPWL